MLFYDRCLVTNMLDCDIAESEFDLHSRYYVHFRINTLGKGMTLFTPPPQLWVE